MNRTFPHAIRIAAFALSIVHAVPGSAIAQQALLTGPDASPTIGRLAAAVVRGDTSEVGAFWQDVRQSGAPLVERDTAHPGHSLVTFLYRAPSRAIAVELQSNLASVDPGSAARSNISLPLESLGESDVRFLTLRLRNDVRVPYRFRVMRPDQEAEQVTDPLNSSTWEPEQSALTASILELRGAPPQPWRAAGAEEGDWDELSLTDAAGQQRTVYVYKPAGWHADRAEPFPALVGLGSFGFGIGMRVDWMIDHLVASGELPPIVVLLLSVDAASEASVYESIEDFVADVLLPYAREHYGVSSRPADIAISGTSRRGMVSSLIALRRPDLAGNVISLSGSYYWKPAAERGWAWVPAQYARALRRPVRFYVAAGELETFVNPGNRGHYLVGTNRHFRDVLRAHGYDMEYLEFNGVHSELNWQDWLARGLVHFFAPGGR